jgi:hypothetical protein
VTEIPKKNILKEKRFILAHCFSSCLANSIALTGGRERKGANYFLKAPFLIIATLGTPSNT